MPRKTKVLKDPDEIARYERAPDVASIARELIAAHHPHLAAIDIVYVFKPKASKKHGRAVLGKARIISGLPAMLAERGTDQFYVIEIAKDTWPHLSAQAQLALVDHELAHLAGPDIDSGKLQIEPHDLEEFADVVRRNGVWNVGIEQFNNAVQQLSFDGLNARAV